MLQTIKNTGYDACTNHKDIGTVYSLPGTFISLIVSFFSICIFQFTHNSWGADAPVRWQIMFQDPGTKSMTNIQELHNDLMFFIVAISVFVLYILLRVVSAFRIENKNTIRRLSLQHHTSLEVIWTLIPAVILMLLALPSYTLLYHLDEILSPRVTLKVLGHQWYWHYEYPDLTKEGFENEGVSFDSYMLPADDLEPVGALRLLDVDNRVVLPIDTSVRALISSSDVIHSWAIPSLGVKVDACPGRLNQVGFNINRAGVFYGQCSEICGVNHSFMPIAIEACRLENFVSWLADVLESAFMGGNLFSKWRSKKNINEDNINKTNKKEEFSEVVNETLRVARQTNDRQPVVKVFENHIEDYPTALNLNYSWSFGSVLGLIFVYQIATGVIAAMHYAPNTLIAFNCLQHLDADVRLGYLMRYMHANGASMIFIVMYLHIGKAIYYRSYTNWKRFGLYLTGLLVFVLMMAVGFLGYTLPWGQMSFWGATVITSLVTAIPSIGPYVGEVVWGGYSVDNATLDRFYSIHYVTPLLIVGLLYLHLVFLHYAKSSNPSGVIARRARIKFLVFFSWKDIALFILFVSGFEALCYYYPDVLGHSDNLIEANSMATPSHIVPEWYFLPFYAILRAVPDKALGVVAMFAAIAVVGVFSFIDARVQRTSGFVWYFRLGFILLVGDFVALAYIGSQPAEQPYVLGSQIAAALYFFFFLVYMPVLCFADAYHFGRGLRDKKRWVLELHWKETSARYEEEKRLIEAYFDKEIRDLRKGEKKT